MCGITGFFSYKNKIDTKKYYNAHIKIAHRGPDDEGFIYKNSLNQIEHLAGNDTIDEFKSREILYNKKPSNLILGHRRLSIIDLSSAGHQPYQFENLYLVYNGEIYNYIEIRDELKELGYSFETKTDTEVFLKAYHCWGVDSFNKFNGMWASAIYDTKENKILLSRDRFGIKPLYYSIVNEELIFGSEIKFIASFIKTLNVDENMVYDYIEEGYISHTTNTFFKDIHQLKQGYYAYYSNVGLEEKEYYKPCKKIKNISIQNIKETLFNSIKLRMKSDVKVGSLLSGGMDSSSIVCSIYNQNLSKNMDTFTITYKEKELDYESKYVDDIVKMTNFNNEGIYLEPNIKVLDDLTYIIESPYRSFSEKGMFKIYEYIKSHTNIIVLLNGDGSDEIFSGYNIHYYYYLLSLIYKFKFITFYKEFNIIRLKIDKTTLKLFIELFKLFLSHIGILRLVRKKKAFFKKRYKSSISFIKTMNPIRDELNFNKNISALPEYLLYSDKISMYHSLEVRVPFLDYRLVEQASCLQNDQLIKDGVTKYTLREAVKDIVPNSVYKRKDKKGFFTPFELWIKTYFKDDIDKELLDIRKNGLFSFMNENEIYNYYIKNGINTKIWRIYCLSRWKKVWNIVS
jgi:asparagine synthase (glutamine-hydrolysing)